jgi:hypothetical protein
MRDLGCAAFVLLVGLSLTASAQSKAPKIWDGKALEDWATPIAAPGVRPGHFTSAEYYGAPVENLVTYPVYSPERDPSEDPEWPQKQKPQRVGSARFSQSDCSKGE